MDRPKPYFGIEDFPKLTPFSEEAIRAKVRRGELVEGKHFFRVGRRLIFKWEAIVAWIEKADRVSEPLVAQPQSSSAYGPLPDDAIPLARGGYLTSRGWHPGPGGEVARPPDAPFTSRARRRRSGSRGRW